jgi:hypothetical protein
MLRLLINENFNQRILRGLRLRLPSLDYVVVQETDMQGLQDRERDRDKRERQGCGYMAYSPW